MVVGFGPNYDRTFIERFDYDIFDFVRDIGGLISGISGLFVVIVALIQF